MELLGDEAQVDTRFGPFGDIANHDIRLVHGLAERTIGSENVLDASDGTPYGLLFWSVWRWR
jgi:hypothetical protein